MEPTEEPINDAILEWSLCYNQDGRTYLTGPYVREEAIRIIKENKLKGIRPEPYVPANWITQRQRELGQNSTLTYDEKITPWYVAHYHDLPFWILPRINKDDPCMIDCYLTIINAKLRKRTSLNIGRFLNQFYSQWYTPDQITVFATEWKGYVGDLDTILWATTEEDIIHVMMNSKFASCANWEYWRESFTHPAAIFASGDWALAYRKNKHGEIISRAYCVPSRKLCFYIRGEHYAMSSALTKAGYIISDKIGDYFGVRFKRVLDPEGYVMSPHIDGGLPIDEDEQGLFVTKEGAGVIHLYGSGYRACSRTTYKDYKSRYAPTTKKEIINATV